MNIDDIQKSVSDEIRAAIKAATPEAVYPKDEFGEPSGCGDGKQQSTVRVAGWDPDETQTNDDLIKKSSAYLTSRGWQVSPETTASDDRSAIVSKDGLGDGRLYASNQGLTFTGKTACTGD
ncbi:hypothetical protein ACQUSR_19120 [Streptomyces sp. P1-3]|uniref:hypothetical protein n=1 Tax=Streptomyces sp. P1-3 TaxID=3421658 RepID=UPI003D36AF49